MNQVRAFFFSFIFASANVVAMTMDEDANRNSIMASIMSGSNENTILPDVEEDNLRSTTPLLGELYY